MTALVTVALTCAGCAAPKRVIKTPQPSPPSETLLPPDPGGERGMQAATLAIEQIGRPYQYGGETPAGFDCSGLVQYVYGQLGVSLPRTVAGQTRAGRSIPVNRLRPGDLLFFRTEGSRISHVGIFVGDGNFVHAPRRGQPVRRQQLSDSWWRGRLAMARRPG